MAFLTYKPISRNPQKVKNELEPELKYNIEFVDNDNFVLCTYKKTHRGFLIFVDENDLKIICRPSSIAKIEKSN